MNKQDFFDHLGSFVLIVSAHFQTDGCLRRIARSSSRTRSSYYASAP